MPDNDSFYVSLAQGNADEVTRLTNEALSTGDSAEAILTDRLLPAMERVGEQFKNNEIFIPEVLIAARAMQVGMGILKPILSKSDSEPMAKVVIGTVDGDLHDIGKNMVAMLLEGGGFDVVDLGVDVSVDDFVEAVREHQPAVLGMSALLTTTMMAMKTTLDAIEAEGLRGQTNVIVGGAPSDSAVCR